MGNPYAPASQNQPNVYESEPTPDPVEIFPGQGSEGPVSDVPSPTPGETPVTLEVPTGTISEVTEWVGEDKERAQAALETEKNGANRKTLITTLESLLSDS